MYVELECMCIYCYAMYIHFSIDRSHEKLEIIIISGSQAAIRVLNSNILRSKLVWECLDKLNELGKRNKITVMWVSENTNDR